MRSSAPLLLHVFSTFGAGGPQQRTVRLIHAIGDRFNHSIVALDGRIEAADLLDRGSATKVYRIPKVRGALHTIAAVRRVIRDERPQAVLTYNWGAVDAALAARICATGGIAHHEDGFGPDEVAGFKRRRTWYRRLVLRGVQRVIVVSKGLRDTAISRWRVPPENVSLIPNGIDLDSYSAQPACAHLRAALNIPERAFVIGTVGHLRAEKRLDRLIRAFGKLTPESLPHLVLVGDGSRRTELVDLCIKLGVDQRVHFTGHQADPRAYYGLMDVFALSSDTEQMPIAILEAMACGLPVVCTDVGDLRHMLPDSGHPVVVPITAKDVEQAFANALGQLYGDISLRHHLGRANRARVEARYSFEAMCSAYRKVYEELVAGSY